MLDSIDRWENEGGRAASQQRALAIPDLEPHLTDGGSAIQRLLFVADAAVADVDQLPPPVRAVIDAAAAVYVLTPTLPGRLAWLADEVDEVRHVADERLDTVLGHMHSIGAHASGAAARGSVLTVIAGAVRSSSPITSCSRFAAQSTPIGRSEGS